MCIRDSIYSKRSELGAGQAQALSAILNSALFDAYFRISNGNTQVSATELRALPLPGARVLEEVAKQLAAGATEDEAVLEVLGAV